MFTPISSNCIVPTACFLSNLKRVNMYICIYLNRVHMYEHRHCLLIRCRADCSIIFYHSVVESVVFAVCWGIVWWRQLMPKGWISWSKRLIQVWVSNLRPAGGVWDENAEEAYLHHGHPLSPHVHLLDRPTELLKLLCSELDLCNIQLHC